MTLNEEAKQIRAEVAALNPGRGRKYTKALRERVLMYMERARLEPTGHGEAFRMLVRCAGAFERTFCWMRGGAVDFWTAAPASTSQRAPAQWVHRARPSSALSIPEFLGFRRALARAAQNAPHYVTRLAATDSTASKHSPSRRFFVFSELSRRALEIPSFPGTSGRSAATIEP
jgi:hypothetical protein